MDIQLLIIQLVTFAIFMLSVVMHEVAHGAVALRLGDATAKMAGRLTLNPLRHIDLFGTIILPGGLLLISIFSGTTPFIVGWAKPVPYNPYNFKDARKGSMLVALAGPLTNFFLAGFFASGLRILGATGNLGLGSGFLAMTFYLIVVVNVMLMMFNLIPIPPLDGSKLLPLILGHRAHMVERFIQSLGPFGLIMVLFLIFPLWRNVVAPAAFALVNLLIGGSVPF